MIEILEQKIREHKPMSQAAFIQSEAEMNKGYYTGQGVWIDKLITEYRVLETEPQKKQRKRITIRRAKHVCNQIENILDQLQTLDNAAISVKLPNDNQQKELNKLLYDLNVEQQAFNSVKHYNIVDGNAFMIASVDAFGFPQFDIIEAKDIFDFYIKNERVFYLIVTLPEKKYRIYTENIVIDYQIGKNGVLLETQRFETGLCYAYHLGFMSDSRTNFKTFKSILEPASDLLKSLTWDGSEYDVIKLCHGIIKQFAYAPRCTYQRQSEQGYEECNDGNLFINKQLQKTPCPSCKGSGMRIHTSSQDIIFLPEPTDPMQTLSLDKLTHTVFIPDSLLESRKKDILDTEDKIIRTVFNSNNVTNDEVVKTATEMTIDLKGVYSMLTKLGKKVSETFIWQVECIADMKEFKGLEVFHGYTMDLNLDSLENMFAQRERAIKAGVNVEVINNIDRAIMKKQHIDNPGYIGRAEVWETFRPFADKTPQERQSIVMSLHENDRERVLYLYWGRIKNDILFSVENFYDLEREKQREFIDMEVDKYIFEVSEPERPTFDDI